jgi:2-succinyl-5-enolpyruvyl-6-hydroxy-3-cyclohexene-1-carboxylate synthase
VGSATDSYLLLRAFVDELARCGMRAACTSPGSRCAPLVLTLAQERRLRSFSHVDERCAGFFALGLAKASGTPVAVACTSGTAAAELLPAAIEAHEARVPLLLLTADRPPELREVGAGQAIDQLKLFGSAAKWFFEVGVHDASPERLRWIRTLACRAFWTAAEGRPGVVHLNFPLREPLVLDGPLPGDETGRADGGPYVGSPSDSPRVKRVPTRDAIELRVGQTPDLARAEARLAELVGAARRGVVVAGRHERNHGGASGDRERSASPGRHSLGEAAAEFCEAVGWPLLADPLSGARRGPAAVAHYDALLRDEGFLSSHRPDLVLRVGDLPVSKPLRTWLGGLADVCQVALDPERAWQDPASVLSESLALKPAAALRRLCEAARKSREAPSAVPARASGNPASDAGRPSVSPSEPDWLAGWRSGDELAAEAILATLRPGVENAGALSEPAVAAELGVLLPEAATLFVASSLPVREIETFWPVRADPPRVLCNRGANGIDGTVSSAFGAAALAQEPVVLLIGDVALAHDIGGLLAVPRLGLALTIVLLDNEGGGIFDFLPVSQAPMGREIDGALAGDGRYASDEVLENRSSDDVYTRHVATPTGLDFAHAAALYGLSHERVRDLPAFRAALEGALAGHGSSIIEVHGTRIANVELYGRVWEAVSRALSRPEEGAAPPA